MLFDLENILKRMGDHNDQQAFRALFDHYNEKLLKTATYFIKSEVLAEEIVADVFINLWHKRHTLVEIDKPECYFYKAVKNKSLDYLRKIREDRIIPIEAANNEIVVKEDSPEEKLVFEEFEALVQASIASLPPKRQLVYRMVKEDQLKYKDVAEVMDISVKTVEYHVGAALAHIKKDIDKYLSHDQAESYIWKLATLMLLIISFII